jgi:hypothetical protein
MRSSTWRTALKLLTTLPIVRAQHGTRFLLEHLLGTGLLLEAWGNDDCLVLAGLFHSVYGTNDYLASHSEKPTRDTIINFIGQDAENIVHIFSHHSHSEVIANARTSILTPNLENSKPYWDKVLELAAANVCEQFEETMALGAASHLHTRLSSLGACESQLSAGAVKTVRTQLNILLNSQMERSLPRRSLNENIKRTLTLTGQ